MQRLIRSFNTLTDELKATLQEQYPDGIDTSHIKTIPTAKGEILRVIELRTPDAMYLIKINAESRAEIDEFLDQEDGHAPVADDIDDDPGIEDGDDGDGTDGTEEGDGHEDGEDDDGLEEEEVSGGNEEEDD